MKTYRLITFAAALLINVLLAQALMDEKVGVTAPGPAQAAAQEAP
jgi:hypothetical protein